MDEKTYKVVLADGTELDNLRMNGNNFVSDELVSSDIFIDNCSPVTISDGETEEMHENMKLVQVTQMGKEYWFVLRDLSPAELHDLKIQSDIEYIAMMTGVDL